MDSLGTVLCCALFARRQLLAVDTNLESKRMNKRKDNNVWILQSRYSTTPKAFSIFRTLSV